MTPPTTDPDILDTDELAERLGIAPNTVRTLARNGDIPALRVAGDGRGRECREGLAVLSLAPGHGVSASR